MAVVKENAGVREPGSGKFGHGGTVGGKSQEAGVDNGLGVQKIYFPGF